MRRQHAVGILVLAIFAVILLWIQKPPDPDTVLGVWRPEVADSEHAEPVPGAMGGARNSHWPTVRRKFLDSPGNGWCQACGTYAELEVHHIQPYHEHPELELNPDNLITLCRQHHFVLGHLRNWKRSNPCVSDDARREYLRRQPAR